MISILRKEDSTYEKILEGPVTLYEIVNEPRIIDYVKRNDKKVIKYLCDHITDLLALALSDSKEQNLSHQAMNIFYIKNYSIIDAAVESNYLQFSAPKILSESTSYLQLTRFVELTQICATFSCEYIETFSYIVQFLPFTEHDLVASSIIELLENDDDLLFIQQVFKFNKLVQRVVENITDLRKCEIQGNRLGNLYEILLKCAQNDILSKSCSNPQVIEVAIDFQDDDDIMVLNPHWNLVLELFSLNFLTDYIPILEYALTVIQPAGWYHEYQVNAINCITKIIESKPDVIEKIGCSYIGNTIITLLKQFPNHTILLTSLVHLISVLLSLKAAIDEIYDQIVTFLLECVDNEDEKILRTFAIRAITKLVNSGSNNDYLSDKNDSNDRLVDICNDVIYDYEKVRTKPYGYEYKSIKHLHMNSPLKIPKLVE